MPDRPTRLPEWLGTRAPYLAAAAVTIAVGLTVHWGGLPLRGAARDVTGDALWAGMVVWLVSVVNPGARPVVRAMAALLVCFGVEWSQLVHTPGLDALRATPGGHLVLGSGFDPRDFAAYGAGVVAACLLERLAGYAAMGKRVAV